MVTVISCIGDLVVTRKDEDMPKPLFFGLDDEKKDRILKTGLAEFAQYGFKESSTNRIVKNAGISKGSLFKYFSNKEDFYFYLLDNAITVLFQDIRIKNLPIDLFERAMKYSEAEFDWYIQNPDQYKLLKNAFIKDHSEIYVKTLHRYQFQGDSFYYKLFEDVNFKKYQWDKEKILNILKWFLIGFNEEFIKEITPDENLNQVKSRYLKCLKKYINMIKEGLDKE